MYSRVMRSAGVMAAVVGCGACLSGSSAFCAETTAGSANSAMNGVRMDRMVFVTEVSRKCKAPAGNSLEIFRGTG